MNIKNKIKIFFYALYIAAFTGFIYDFAPALRPVGSYILLLIEAIITYLGITLLGKASKRIQLVILAFIIVSTLSYFSAQDHTLGGHLNGIREFTDIFFLFVFFEALFQSEYQQYFNKRFKKFINLFLIVQIPISFAQYVKAGYEAGDAVGGSFGSGGSGILTFSIFVVVLFLVEDSGAHKKLKEKLQTLFSKIIYLLPITINETKISFILIPLYFLSLFKKKDLKTSIISIGVAALLLGAFSSLYTDQGKSYNNPIEEIFSSDFLDKYLSGDVGDNGDVPRFTKIAFATALFYVDPTVMILGKEYGAFKGGTTVDLSNFSKTFHWLLVGSRPYIFFLMVSGGLSLILIIYYLFFSEFFKTPLNGYNNSKPLLIFLICLFIIIQMYNDAFRNQAFSMIFIYALFYAKYYNSGATTRT